MKIQLDTKSKTITVDESVNIDEFLKVIKRLFPNNEWKKYTLETTREVQIIPTYIDRWPTTIPWWERGTLCIDRTVTKDLQKAGIVDVYYTGSDELKEFTKDG